MTDKRKCLVTGGAGYIGAHIVGQLCEEGHSVVVFDNFSSGEKKNVDPRATIVEGDILEKSDLQQVMDNPVDVVFHFAALKAAGDSMIHPEAFSRNNITGTLNLIDACVAHGVKEFVFSSSAAIYGSPLRTPLDETHPKNPDNYYGYTKLAIEENLAWYGRLKGLRSACLRYFNATGYGQNGRIQIPERTPTNLCPVIMEVAAGRRDKIQVFGTDYETPDGTGVRDYIHVDDLVSAHLLAMNYLQREQKSIAVNLGTGRGYSVLEMIDAAARTTGRPIPYETVERRPGDPAALIASSDLAKTALGWEAKHSDIETIFKSMCPVYDL